MNDDLLLRKYVDANDREALGVLFRRHADAAYNTALRVCRNSADAEDAVQSAFIKVMQTAGDFRGGGENGVRFWIMKIVIGTCKNAIRSHVSRRQREERAMEESEGVILPPEDAASTGDDLRAHAREVLKAFDELPEHYRAAMWLHHYQGMSMKEAAAALEIPENTVKNNVYRGMQMLRETLADAGIAASATSIALFFPGLPVEPIPASLLVGLAKILGGATNVAAKAATVGAGIGLLKPAIVGLVVVSAAATGGVVLMKHAQTAPPPAAVPAIPARETLTGNVEYVDGEIIFRGDFTKDLAQNGQGGWQTGFMARKDNDKYEMLDDTAAVAKCVRTEKRDVRGKQSGALVIAAPRKSNTVTFVTPIHKLVKAYSIEFKHMLQGDTAVDMVIAGIGKTERVFDGPVRIREGQWSEYRIEVVPRGNKEIGEYFETQEYVEGKRFRQIRYHTTTVHPGFAVHEGTVIISDYVIREMVPKTETGSAR